MYIKYDCSPYLCKRKFIFENYSVQLFLQEGNFIFLHPIDERTLKETYGDNFETECTLHNYSEENILRGMIVENLTQRGNELMEVTENLNAIRKFLKDNCSASEQKSIKKDSLGRNQSREEEAGSIRNIHNWLNKTGDVMSIGKISEYLKVYDNLESFEEKADYLMNDSINKSSFDKIDLQIKSISLQNKEIIKLLREMKNER